MNPSTEEIDETLARMERDQGEYHAFNKHNRRIAKKAVESYRAKKSLALGVDDFAETRVNGSRALWPTDDDSTERFKRMVNGDVERPRRSGIFYGLGLLISILLISYAILKSI